jgi:hypothetical protein
LFDRYEEVLVAGMLFPGTIKNIQPSCISSRIVSKNRFLVRTKKLQKIASAITEDLVELFVTGYTYQAYVGKYDLPYIKKQQ